MRFSLFALLAAASCCYADNVPLRPWPDYQVFMWVEDSPYKTRGKLALFWQRLREMGVTAGSVHGDGDLRPLLDAKFPYYVENMVNKGLCLKWSSKVSDWDRWVTEWRVSRDEAGLVREYCFDDLKWRGWARKEMESLVRKNAPHSPFLYDIRDELSVTQSADPFDYDFHPLALLGFREWLKKNYASLEALNAVWETQFKSWDEVKPFTSDRIKNRMASGEAAPRGNPEWHDVQRLKFSAAEARKRPTAWNFSPWADHRTYMDVSLAATLGDLRSAAHAIDPKTPVGIEGTQMPSAFGGYDLWRLSQALDWVEPYDICDSREILGSFMPGRPFLTTVGETDAKAAQRRLWHLLLLGDKGCIVWWSRDCIDWKSPEYALTPRAQALAGVFKEMRSPVAGLFMRAQRETDPIAIHYSQPSIQVAWLIESTVDGSSWLRRFSSSEATYNKHARVRHGWLETLQDLGYSPRFVSSEQIATGALRDFKVLVLPQSWALSETELPPLAEWLTSPKTAGTALADGTPGLFDGHGRLLARSPLENEFPLSADPVVRTAGMHAEASAHFAADMTKIAAERISSTPPREWYGWLAKQIPIPLGVKVPPEARVQTHRYRLGTARLLAFERNISYAMGEDLKQGGGNAELEMPVDITASLGAVAHAYDLRTGKYLGQTSTLKFTLDSWHPSLFALTAEKLADGEVAGELLKMMR